MFEEPDFYLSSTDYRSMEQPRRCRFVKRLSGDQRDDLMLVQVDPPIDGTHFKVGRFHIDQVILAARHAGYTLFPITVWPAYVHVAFPLVSDPEERSVIRGDEMYHFAWAELYQTEAAAREKKM